MFDRQTKTIFSLHQYNRKIGNVINSLSLPAIEDMLAYSQWKIGGTQGEGCADL